MFSPTSVFSVPCSADNAHYTDLTGWSVSWAQSVLYCGCFHEFHVAECSRTCHVACSLVSLIFLLCTKHRCIMATSFVVRRLLQPKKKKVSDALDRTTMSNTCKCCGQRNVCDSAQLLVLFDLWLHEGGTSCLHVTRAPVWSSWILVSQGLRDFQSQPLWCRTDKPTFWAWCSLRNKSSFMKSPRRHCVHVCARLSTFEQAGRYDVYGLKCCLILAGASNCLSQQHALQ